MHGAARGGTGRGGVRGANHSHTRPVSESSSSENWRSEGWNSKQERDRKRGRDCHRMAESREGYYSRFCEQRKGQEEGLELEEATRRQHRLYRRRCRKRRYRRGEAE